ncbi:MAG: endonuclease [Lactobacillales bacterium]|jgi:deoxyribonuclease-1|nr:endonuclease [Lactobacillales bacterium]
MFFKTFFLFLAVVFYTLSGVAGGNTQIDSFYKSKYHLEKYVYATNRYTFYCGAEFDESKKITLPDGFYSKRYPDRSLRLEWEHIVPAENFGRHFAEWYQGHPDCRDKNNETYRGRKCAEKTNRSYKLMQADMYNLVPSVGSVNAGRQNYPYRQFKRRLPPIYGSCPMIVRDRRVQPPEHTRGMIARAYQYFESAYPVFKMSAHEKKMMGEWDSAYPVTLSECVRCKRIEEIQGNENTIVKEKCIERRLWRTYSIFNHTLKPKGEK